MSIIGKLKSIFEDAKPKIPKPKYKCVGGRIVPHFYHPRIRKVRKIIRKYGGNIERAIAENPELADVRVKQVVVRRMQRI